MNQNEYQAKEMAVSIGRMLNEAKRLCEHVSDNSHRQARLDRLAEQINLEKASMDAFCKEHLGYDGDTFTERLTRLNNSDNPFSKEARQREAREQSRSAMNGNRQLSKPNGSAFHRLGQAFQDNEQFDDYEAFEGDDAKRWWDTHASKSHVFVIEHDWAAIFTDQTFAESEIRLPFEHCVFEYLLNGMRVCACCEMFDGELKVIIFLETKAMWIVMCPNEDMQERKVANFIIRQVKAALIMLEAEVATTEIFRAPHRLNRKREKLGRIPLYDYHIVKLDRRSRPETLPPEHDSDPRRSPRCHFRRGHWRHFGSFKTWIKWMLVGDPDLGFIEKHYEL